MKKNKNNYIELIIIFILTFLFTILNKVTYDEIWNYGFSYNIANGLMPYRDFNMVLTPLYPFIGSLFLILLGKNIIIFHLFNALICTTIFNYLKKQNKRSYYISYIMLLMVSDPNYDLFILLLLYILINLEKNNNNDYYIGITLSLTFLTKQNIGFALCIPSLFIKNKDKIFKRIVGFFIPNIILLIYLITTNTLYDFINYSFLGLNGFFIDNFLLNPICILTVISIIYSIYMYINNHKIEYLYILFFQIIAFPIFNFHHVAIGFIPVCNSILSNFKFIKKYTQIVFLGFITVIFTINIIYILIAQVYFLNSTNKFKYRIFDKSSEHCIKSISNYYLNLDSRVFILDDLAYIIKLELGIPINKYDLINNGNLGKNGEDIVVLEIEKMCSHNNCIFLLKQNNLKEEEIKSQTNKKILNYIHNNYNISNRICDFTVYNN